MTITFVASIEPAPGQFEANTRPPRPEVRLPEGPVRGIIRESCSACHGIDEYGYYAMDRAGWEALVDRMKSTSSGVVKGAVISDADKDILVDWLVEQFGPDHKPFPRQYVVREVLGDDRLDDSEGRAELERACSSCHDSPDAVLALGADLEESGWRETLTGKIAIGAPLLVDQVDPLVEWLTR